MKKLLTILFLLFITTSFSQTITSVSPLTASEGKEVLFTVSGNNLNSGMAFFIENLNGGSTNNTAVEISGGNSTKRYFKGTFQNSPGTKVGIIKDAIGGTELFNFSFNVIPKPTVTLLQPNSGNFTTGVGTQIEIKWQSTNQDHWEWYVFKGGELISREVSNNSTDNNKSTIWTIPSSVIDYNTNETHILDGNDYQIKIAIFNTNDGNTSTSAGDLSNYITFTPSATNSAPEHINSSITPNSATSGSQFTFYTTWNDPEDDTIDAVDIRYRKTGANWSYIQGDDIDYVSGTNPPRYTVTKTITGSAGNYEFQAKAKDDKGLASSWENGASFQITEASNTPPNTPSFQNVPNTIYQNQQINISVTSGTDADNDNTLVKLHATGTNHTQSNPYETNLQSDGSNFTIPLTFSQTGNKTITAYTEDSNGAVSSNKTYNITVQTQASNNTAPNSASFVNVPQEVTVNESVNITVKKGTDSDGDATKLLLYANNSNYTSSIPFESSLNNSTANIPVDITFTSEGTKTISIKTVDENGAESSISTKTINVVLEDTSPSNITVGQITFTASTITEVSNNKYTLSGNVKANNLLEFTGVVTVDVDDLKVEGIGKVFLNNIHGVGEVQLYNGAFEYNVPNNTSELIGVGINEANELFKMAELPVHINKINILNDGINIEGQLEFPEFFDGFRGDITQLQITKTNGIQLVGDVAIDEIDLPNFDFKNLVFSFDTINDKFAGSGEIETTLFTAGANVEIITTGVNQVGMFLTLNNPKPLGTTGLSLAGLEGDISNIQTHPNPPMSITIGCSLVPTGVSTDVVEFSDVSLTYKFGTSLEGNGTFTVMGRETANAGFVVSEGLFKVNAEINFYDVVNAAIEAGIAKNDSNSIDVFARFMASINIPNGDGFPFGWIDAIPGVDLPYTVAEFDNILYNNELTGKGEIGWFNVNFSYKLSYDGTLQKEFAKNFSLFNEITFPGGTTSRTTALKFQVPSSKYANKNSKSYNRFEERSLIIKPSEYKNAKRSSDNRIVQDFVITSNEIETIIVRIKPETNGDRPNFTLTTPNGEEISQSNVSNFSNVEYTENIDDKAGYFTINTPSAGSWDINLEDNGNAYLADIIGTKNKPGIVINNIEKTNNNLKIDWTDYNPDFNGQISLYYDYDNEGIDGNLITSGISEDDETDSYNFDVSNLQTGEYYIYAIMFDDEGTPVTNYSVDSFTISSQISAPTDLTYTVNTDNSVTFNWAKLDNTNNYDYLLYQEENNNVGYSSQNINTGNANNVTLSDIDIEPIHQFIIVAKDSNGNLSEKSNVLEIDLAKKQTINLNTGWNLIGFGLESFNTNTTNIATLLDDKLLQIKTESESFNPNLPDYLNTLQTLENGQGYWINVSEETSINLRGKEIDLATTSIALNQGWNLISYPSLNTINIETALQSVSDFLIQIKNINKSYNPSLPPHLNTLQELRPGEGYWINVNQNCTITF